jgi:hypothetical protein
VYIASPSEASKEFFETTAGPPAGIIGRVDVILIRTLSRAKPAILDIGDSGADAVCATMLNDREQV